MRLVNMKCISTIVMSDFAYFPPNLNEKMIKLRLLHHKDHPYLNASITYFNHNQTTISISLNPSK